MARERSGGVRGGAYVSVCFCAGTVKSANEQPWRQDEASGNNTLCTMMKKVKGPFVH